MSKWQCIHCGKVLDTFEDSDEDWDHVCPPSAGKAHVLKRMDPETDVNLQH